MVLRQRAALQYLIGMLIEARPITLLSVQRERPATVRQRTLRDQPSAESNAHRSTAKGEEPADFFDIAPATSLRIPGRVGTEGFKLEFSGQTRVLRDFLNGLVADSAPFVVRSIEADPLASSATSVAGMPAARATDSIVIVAAGVSRFKIVVELVTLFDETGEPQS